MPSVHQRDKSPYWWAKYRDAGNVIRFRSTKQVDRRSAMKVAETWQSASDKARRSELTQAASIKVLSELMEATTGSPLVVESIEGFLRGWLASRSALGRSDATAKRYDSVIVSFLDSLGTQRVKASIASLSASEIEKWRNAELGKGKGSTTADFGVKILRAALNSARRNGLILSNPAEAIEAVGDAAESRDPFTMEELASMLKSANDEWKGMILFGVWCGLRIADAANLTWGSIDIAHRTLTFQPSKTRSKSAAPLRIGLHEELVEYLATAIPGVGKAPIFPTLHGRKPGSHGGLSNEFSRLMKDAGVVMRKGKEKKGLGRQFNSKGFHSLRHTMISRMADAEVSPDVRRAIAGHSSDAQHRKYVHLSIEAQQSALNKLSRVKAG